MAELDEVDVEDRTIDSIIEQLDNPADVSCFLCKHLNGDMVSCKAFPRVIKAEIISGRFAHTKEFGGEKKKAGKPILFEPKE